jgi:hypothetical protein
MIRYIVLFAISRFAVERGDCTLFPSNKYKYEQKKRKMDKAFDPDYNYVYGIHWSKSILSGTYRVPIYR